MSKREIKFRGKRVDNGDWVFGDLLTCPISTTKKILVASTNMQFIGTKDEYEVIPNTLGQYTGEKDQDGNEIYEGDSVEYEWYDESVGLWQHTSATVWFNTGSFQPLPDVLSTRNYKLVK